MKVFQTIFATMLAVAFASTLVFGTFLLTQLKPIKLDAEMAQ